MSGTHSPTSDASNGSRTRLTRTVAIIKNHALGHRMDIEERIQKAGFEIVKERQMEFDQNSDHEFLQELFGKDMPSLFEGPVWVYVLERRRAVEMFKALMGEDDPQAAREASPNSLRALFGENESHNAVMGAPDNETAETQIQCLFQSSPPFCTQDPDGAGDVNDIQHELGNDGATESGAMSDDWQSREQMFSPLSSQLSRSGTRVAGFASPGSTTSSKGSGNGKNFRARALPKTHEAPDIAPRMSRAAALRVGISVPEGKYDKPRVVPTKEELKQVFMDVPGHKRSTTIQVASTAPPVIAPRMTKAASLRQGKGKPAPTSPSGVKPRRPSSSGNIFEGVPGHKRRESIQVASVQAPTVGPRLNKSAELRAKKDLAPPVSFMFRPPTVAKSRSSTSQEANSRPGSGSSLARPTSSLLTNRGVVAGRSTAAEKPVNGSATKAKVDDDGLTELTANVHVQQIQIQAQPMPMPMPMPMPPPPRPPSIEPRLNKSALLRARAKAGGPTPPVKQVPVTNRRSSVIF